MCAQDVPQAQRSQDVRTTQVHFCDNMQTINIIAYSEIYDQPLKQFVLGKHVACINILRHACAYTGLHKDELVVRRLQMPTSGRWKKSTLRRQIVLEIAYEKAKSDRSAISVAVPSSRTPLSPLASVPLCVTPTRPVKVKGGK